MAITGLRGVVTEREPRLAVGLLLNSRDQETFYSLLRQAFPGCEPGEKFIDVWRKLAAAGIGFPENDASIDLVGPLLEGKSDSEVVALMVEQFDLDPAEMGHASEPRFLRLRLSTARAGLARCTGGRPARRTR